MNTDFARQQMVQQQVRAWEVLDEDVLDILATTPREAFVPAGYRSLAFAETEIPIGHGETMLMPVIEGRILQSLAVEPEDRVLVVGTGSGFLSACLARMAKSVVSIDIHGDFLEQAEVRLEAAGINNVELAAMDATERLPDEHFDAIAVTGSLESFDPRFVKALKPGGRLFVVVGKPPVMEARLVTRGDDSDWRTEALFETDLKPLVNGALPPQFHF